MTLVDRCWNFERLASRALAGGWGGAAQWASSAATALRGDALATPPPGHRRGDALRQNSHRAAALPQPPRSLIFLVGLVVFVFGCGHAPPQMPPMKTPEVDVTMPIYREVVDHEDFTGQTESVKTIDIRARVTGYLKSVNFKHGAEVKKGDLLFEIDPPHYKWDHARAEGVAAQAEARLKRLKLDYARAERLRPSGTITKEQFDLVSGDLAEAEANLTAAKASLKMASVALGYCTIKAPIDGRMSRPNIDPGNLVKADDTDLSLTRIVAQDPMWVYFDLDERTMLRLRRLHKDAAATDGGVTDAAPTDGAPTDAAPTDGGATDASVAVGGVTEDIPVFIGVADEDGYPHQGRLDFRDNRLDPNTGTLRVRGVFPNADRFLTPGMFVHVRLPIGEPHQALLVPEQAVGTDQGQKFVYVMNDKDEVTYRRVRVGKLYEALRVISEGISPGERVVVTGVQRVMPGMKVDAKLVRNGSTDRRGENEPIEEMTNDEARITKE